MWNTWTKISQKNVDHYNNHTAEHNMLTLVAAGAAATVVAAIGWTAKKDAEKNMHIHH